MAHKEKIRVLLGIRQGKIGGGESVLLTLVENLDKDIFEPVVLSFTDGPMIDQLKQAGVSTHVIYTEKPFDIRVWNKVKKLIRKEKIDLVHAHGTRAQSNMFWAARKNKLPLIYTSHGWSFHLDQNKAKQRLRILGEKYLTRKATVNICVSHSNAETGRELFEDFNPIVILNSIDSKKFDPHGSYKDVRKELGISEGEIVITSVARFTWQKQPLVLIRAFAEAAKQLPDIKLMMVGDGEEKEKAVELIRQFALEDKILLLPFRKDVPDLLAAADIFALPSLWEGLPVALLEAMSMGKAIIASRVDGTAEIIRHDDNGVLIAIDNLQQNLTEQIVRLAQDPKLRAALSQRAIESIAQHYNVQTMTRKNEAIYADLINQQR